MRSYSPPLGRGSVFNINALTYQYLIWQGISNVPLPKKATRRYTTPSIGDLEAAVEILDD